MTKYIEVEDEHFKKMLMNIEAITMVFEKDILRSEIYLQGIDKPFVVRKTYREVKSLIESAGKE